MIKFTNDPEKDPTHPKTTLPPRQAGDVFLRLTRAYGFKRGLRLYGLFQAAISNDPDVQQAIAMRPRRVLHEDLNLLKAVNLAPDELYPAELVDWLNSWFNAGFDIGLMTGEAIWQFRAERRSGDKLPQT